MWNQLRAIVWAQLRTTRNHLPRSHFGLVLGWLLTLLWYGLYATVGAALAFKLPDISIPQLGTWLPAGLLAVFLFWQVVPLVTLSSGWSLELNKLQAYPLSVHTLFSIETLLRFSSAPEMVLVLAGTLIGLERHPGVPLLAPLFLLLFVPFNLFAQLAIRDFILQSFKRNRFRELFAVLIISVAVLPQLVLRTGLGPAAKPYFLRAATHWAAPWFAVGSLSLGRLSVLEVLMALLSISIAFWAAYRIFRKSIAADNAFRANPAGSSSSVGARFSTWPSLFFSDPFAALVQRELQSLVRMPRFRILFGMSCVLGVLVFVPTALNHADPTSSFIGTNLIPVVNVYGLLLLSDTLLLNAFGMDRGVSQLYFVSPLDLRTVLKAKNLTALIFVVLQSTVIFVIAAVAHLSITALSVVSGLLASAVVSVFLLATGNFSSLIMARPIDPQQTFKKQGGAQMQLWLLGCAFGLFILLGFAFLARYALASDWAFLGILVFELLIGLTIYRIGMDSAVRRGLRDRELIVQKLSRNAAPVSLS